MINKDLLNRYEVLNEDGQPHNYCTSIDGTTRPWCYTTGDPRKGLRWKYCDPKYED